MKTFISHVSQDRDLAQDLAGQLRQAGIDVWNQYEEIYPGDNWEKKVGTALEESQVMVVLMTRQARGSEMLARQVQYALTSGKYQGRVVPVVVGMQTLTAGEDVPWILLSLDPIYVSESPGDLPQVVSRIKSVIQGGYSAAT